MWPEHPNAILVRALDVTRCLEGMETSTYGPISHSFLHTGGHGRRKIRRSYVQATAAAACCSRRCRQLSSSRYLAARLQGTARAYGAARGALGANSPLSELQGPSSRCAQPNHSVLAAARRERPDRTARVPGAAPACARCRAGGRLTAVPSRRTTQ